ncbi:MAG: hypothetical protein WDN46_17650 [Methylocella sp.]
MELSSSPSGDRKWKIPASDGPIYREHVTFVAVGLAVLRPYPELCYAGPLVTLSPGCR